MEWIQVESSQIACLGYEPEAEYPLGVKFTPTKKQAAAGQTGSVYEYANVTPQLFRGLIEAKVDPAYLSHYKFFDKHIKSQPELYPFRKVEPDPPIDAATGKEITE